MTANTPPVSPSRGEVYWADLKPATGHEQGGQPRPVIVFSVNTFNHGPAQMAVIVPTTTTIRPKVA